MIKKYKVEMINRLFCQWQWPGCLQYDSPACVHAWKFSVVTRCYNQQFFGHKVLTSEIDDIVQLLRQSTDLHFPQVKKIIGCCVVGPIGGGVGAICLANYSIWFRSKVIMMHSGRLFSQSALSAAFLATQTCLSNAGPALDLAFLWLSTYLLSYLSVKLATIWI